MYRVESQYLLRVLYMVTVVLPYLDGNSADTMRATRCQQSYDYVEQKLILFECGVTSLFRHTLF